MLKDEICKKREELNNSILTGKDYETILRISIELDELIAKYYKDNSSVGGGVLDAPHSKVIQKNNI